MRTAWFIVMLSAVAVLPSCRTVPDQCGWLVEQTGIALYHSSTADPASGFIAHVEYCGTKLSRGSAVLHIVYRPIDFPNRNPGFDKGDMVIIKGLEKAKDFGAVEGPDYWIYDINVSKPAEKPDSCGR